MQLIGHELGLCVSGGTTDVHYKQLDNGKIGNKPMGTAGDDGEDFGGELL